jgi:predicted ATPase
MPIQELYVAGYRSVRQVRLTLRRINVLSGPNGCGKSNLYQSMYLLASAANGELARTFADEGGMPSALWAGPRRPHSKQEPLRLALSVTFNDMLYELRCGLPTPPGHVTRTEPSQFLQDPEVKEESLCFLDGRKRITLMERDSGSMWLRDIEGRRVTYPMAVPNSDSVLSHLREPHLYPQLSAVAQELKSWRFYHHFRTDPEAPARHPQVGVRTPVLDRDGRDLAAALQTIREIGDKTALERAIDAAFPGAELTISSGRARFSLTLQMPGINRPFEARELSDGTLRYLCLLAALLSPRPPSVLALNEPETSLHPDLLDPLAQLIADASGSSQLWITTHSLKLAEAIERFSGEEPIRLEKVNGETRVAGASLLESGALPIRTTHRSI